MSTGPVIGLLAVAVLLAGCTAGEPAPTGSPTGAQPTSAAAEEPATDEPATDPATDEPATDPVADPVAMPDPATLVGSSLVETLVDGTWVTLVDDVPLDLRSLGGACTGPADDVCATSVALFTAPGEGDVPTASPTGLILLLASTGALADGTPTWQVVDGLVTATPDGEPDLLELCDGPTFAVIYPAGGVDGATIPVAAAWGIDGATLVPLDPAGLTCAYLGD